ncbi:MAG: redoxin family protein [Gammaproteobacteria bacterium]
MISYKNTSPLRIIITLAAIAKAALIPSPLAHAEPPTESGIAIGDFALLDQDGRFHRLYQNSDARFVVLFVHGIGCPIVRNSLATLKNLRTRYAQKGVRFFLINANPQDDRAALKHEATLYDIDFPILKDQSQLVAESLSIKRTAEVILIDTRDWTIRYRGPIDDRLHYEIQKKTVSRRYLQDSLDALLDHRPIASPQLPGVGCLIHTGDTPQQPPSFAREIVPLLREKCIICHRPDGVGPWSMNSYQTVRGWSAMMREVVMNKRMPPWHADPSIGEFSPNLSLSVAEQKALIRWIDAGAPRGTDTDPLSTTPIAPAGEWPLGTPDLVIDIPEQHVPAQGVIPYRWLKLPVPLASDKWVRAVHLKPSNRAVLHHGFVLVKYPKHAKNREPRWLEGRNGFFAAYVPGFDALPFPERSGQFLPAGATLLFQLHYVPIGREMADKPRLALYFHATPPSREYRVASATNMAIRIPPHAPAHEESAEASVAEEGLLHAFYPHMHYRGSRFQYQAIYPDGRSEALLSVPNYNFNWQTVYNLKNPKPLPSGTKIIIRAIFDNSARNPANPDPSREVRWGLQSADEMLVGYFMYSTQRKHKKPQPGAKQTGLVQRDPYPN